MENIILLHIKKHKRVIKAITLTKEELKKFRNNISDVYENQTGGWTIIVSIHIFYLYAY